VLFSTTISQQRKGVPAHTMILDAYLRGMNFEDADVVVVVDILPNRPIKVCLL